MSGPIDSTTSLLQIRRRACGARAPRSGRAAVLAFAALAVACGGKAPELAVSTETPSTAAPTAPRPVAFDPANGATGVDPARRSITVTFDREMDRQGWAWVIENPATAPKTGESHFDPTGRTNTVEVELEPGRDYVVWVNSPEYPYFRDPSGVPSTPTRWTFSTRGGAPAASSGAVGAIAAHATGAPRVVAFDPPNGATGVDPGRTELRVTFDRAMSEGWSWVTEGQDLFPETTGDAYMTPDRRTAVLPVRLGPGRSYALWLNSQQYRYFRDPSGAELEPVRWSFTTAAPAP